MNASNIFHRWMDGPTDSLRTGPTCSVRAGMRQVERRQWWLSFSSVLVTLLLTVGIVSISFVVFLYQRDAWDRMSLHTAIRSLVEIVLLFAVYVIYQQLQIYRFRLHLVEQEEIFRLIGEN